MFSYKTQTDIFDLLKVIFAIMYTILSIGFKWVLQDGFPLDIFFSLSILGLSKNVL